MNIGSLLITIGIPLLALEFITFRIPLPFFIYDIGLYSFISGIFLFHLGRLIAKRNE